MKAENIDIMPTHSRLWTKFSHSLACDQVVDWVIVCARSHDYEVRKK